MFITLWICICCIRDTGSVAPGQQGPVAAFGAGQVPLPVFVLLIAFPAGILQISLILGGVEIPWDRGLDGHSDADVVIHALMDALLGAAAMGDIGVHFPDDDPRYEGADSSLLLREVIKKLDGEFYRVANVDITIMAQSPKLQPYIPEMRRVIAGCLEVSPERVSVKATTTERLGFIGREEGIACQAAASIYR